MKPNLLLDLDGVVADFFNGFGTFLNDNYGTSLDLSQDPTSYHLREWDESCTNLDTDEALLKWVNSDGFAKLPCYKNAQEFVAILNDLANVWTVTARVGDFEKKFGLEVVEKIKQDTRNWVKNNKFDIKDVYFEHDKVPFCLKNDISILIEDKLSTALDASKNGINSILVNRGWNQYPDRYRLYRVFDYQTALDWVRKLT
jgi:uncharacterized HAD superfamily protein